MQRDAVERALKISDLREGDILIMLGPLPWASIVCCCGLSWGVVSCWVGNAPQRTAVACGVNASHVESPRKF